MRTYKKDYDPNGGAVESHSNNVKRAKKLIKKKPKNKYYCKVTSGIQPFEIRNTTKKGLESHKKVWSANYPDRVLTFGEIKPILIS